MFEIFDFHQHTTISQEAQKINFREEEVANEIFLFIEFDDKINSNMKINTSDLSKCNEKINITFQIRNLLNKPKTAGYVFEAIKQIKHDLSKNIQRIVIYYSDEISDGDGVFHNFPKYNILKNNQEQELEDFLDKLLTKIYTLYFIKIILLIIVVIIVVVTIAKKPSHKNNNTKTSLSSTNTFP